MATLQTVPFKSQPHRVDTSDPAFNELFAMIDQMFQELYQDVNVLDGNITTINTSTGSGSGTSGVTIAQVSARALHGI